LNWVFCIHSMNPDKQEVLSVQAKQGMSAS
jgi:hypothetical protein